MKSYVGKYCVEYDYYPGNELHLHRVYVGNIQVLGTTDLTMAEYVKITSWIHSIHMVEGSAEFDPSDDMAVI